MNKLTLQQAEALSTAIVKAFAENPKKFTNANAIAFVVIGNRTIFISEYFLGWRWGHDCTTNILHHFKRYENPGDILLSNTFSDIIEPIREAERLAVERQQDSNAQKAHEDFLAVLSGQVSSRPNSLIEDIKGFFYKEFYND